jgi:TRAP transporter TAXI family solute receptor
MQPFMRDTQLFAAAMLACFASAVCNPATALTQTSNRGLVEIITGSSDTTALRIASDISDLLDDGTRRILPVVGKGAVQNLADLRALRGIDLAIVQTDVLDEARRTPEYRGIEQSLAYIAKLHNEEFHLLVAPQIQDVAELAGTKVNFGVPGDGTAVTASAVFNELKIRVEPTAYEFGLALAKLREGEIAALAVVTGKPASAFATIPPGSGLHFVSLPSSSGLLARYVPATLTAEDYPNLAGAPAPVETVAVGSVLLVANLSSDSERYRNVVRFVDAFFTQFPKLTEGSRHPKWQEVNLAAELPSWRRFPAAETWLRREASNLATSMPDREQLHQIFSRFLDERSRAATGKTMDPGEKSQLFEQFRQWQISQARAPRDR